MKATRRPGPTPLRVAAPHAEWIGRRLLPIDKAMSSVGVAAADPAEDLAHP